MTDAEQRVATYVRERRRELADIRGARTPAKSSCLMGYECHAIGQAMGIENGWRRLVLVCDLYEPVKLYVQHFLKEHEQDKLVDTLQRMGASNRVAVQTVKSVEVDADGNVAIEPLTPQDDGDLA